MSKSAGKKSAAKNKGKGKGDVNSSPGHDDERLGKILNSRHNGNGEQFAKPALDISSLNDKFGQKREYEEDDDVQYGSEMNSMLKMFGTDMSKAINAKKKRVESFTVETMKANQKMVVDPWENQLNNSMEIANELFKLNMSVLEQADNDIAQMKDHDLKMFKIFKQQMKTNEQNRNIMIQRVAACRQVNDTFMKKAKEQDVKHREELTNMQFDLKKELSSLQKKMLNDVQKDKMENLKKNLTKMYYMSD